MTLRATGTVTLFDGYLTLYQEGHDDEDEENGSKPPKVAAGDSTGSRKSSAGAAFHRAAAALFRSLAGAQAGRTRHRQALHLCHYPFGAARPRLCAHGSRPLHSRGQRPARHRVPFQFLPPLCRIRLHRRSRRKARRSGGRRSRLEAIATRFLEGFLRRRRRDQGPENFRTSSPNSTKSWDRTSSRPARTAPIRASARPVERGS